MEHHSSHLPESGASTPSSRSFLAYSHPHTASMLPSGTPDIYHEPPQQCPSRKRHLDSVTGFEASESDSLEEPTTYSQPSTSTTGSRPSSSSGPPPNGKKTKGRVKIKMEYIDNKLRRYTTFSKRKTGIMKKAYELSTLTGTQVMLLVASETGHVYTFATRKLQPMITSEAGKALIQTCLNSPDAAQPMPQATSATGDQRMSATGFEETELSYHIEDGEKIDGSPKSDGNDSDSSCNESDIEDRPPPPPLTRGSTTSTSTTAETALKSEQMHIKSESNGSSSVTPLIPVSLGNFPASGLAVYHTPQGMMYTTPHSSVPGGVLFAVQAEGGASGSSKASPAHTNGPSNQQQQQQQFITIPFPVTMGAVMKSADMQSSPADLSKK